MGLRVLLLMVLILLGTALPVLAEVVQTRAGRHPTFGRMVFEYERSVPFEVRQEGDRLILTFGRPMEGPLGVMTTMLPAYIGNLALNSDRTVLTVTLKRPVTARTQRYDGTVVVDLVDAPPGAAFPAAPSPATGSAAAPPSAPVAAAPVAAAPIAAPAPRPRPPAPVPPATPSVAVAEAPPQQVAALPAEAVPAEPPQTAPAAGAATPLPAAEAVPLVAAQEAQSAPLAAPAFTTPLAVPPRPAAPTVPVGLDVEAGWPQLTFPWPVPVGAAVFQRDDRVWIAFSQAADMDLKALWDNPLLSDATAMRAGSGTIVGLRLRDPLRAMVRREGNTWSVDLQRRDRPPANPIPLGTEGAVMQIPLQGMSPPIDWTDPEVGDQLAIVPLAEPDTGVAAPRRQPRFMILPSAQGLVVARLADGVSVTGTPHGVAIATDDGPALAEVAPPPAPEAPPAAPAEAAHDAPAHEAPAHDAPAPTPAPAAEPVPAHGPEPTPAPTAAHTPAHTPEHAPEHTTGQAVQHAPPAPPAAPVASLPRIDPPSLAPPPAEPPPSATLAQAPPALDPPDPPPDPLVAAPAPAPAVVLPPPVLPPPDPPPVRPVAVVNLERWGRGELPDVEAERRQRMRDIAQAREGSRNRMRVALGKYLVAHGLAAEALGALGVAATADPDVMADATVRAARGLALAQMGRGEEALRDLNDPSIAGDPHAALWRGMIALADRDWPRAAQELATGREVADQYDEPWPSRFALAEAEAALEIGNADEAAQALSTVDIGTHAPPLIQAEEAYLSGRLAEMRGQPDEAMEAYDRAVALDVTPVRVRAEMARINLGVAKGTLGRPDAVARLDRLRFAWRGDGFELKVLTRLGELQMEDGDWRGAFQTYKQAIAAFPDTPTATAMAATMADAFKGLFLGGKADQMSPVAALGLYYDYRELTPLGAEGDEMIRRLADRLVAVELFDRAAELLQHQVRYRLTGTAKAQIAARLALVQLLDGKPDAALQTLAESDQPLLPEALERQRRQLRARALADLRRPDEALALLVNDADPESTRLAAEIAWGASNWKQAAASGEQALADRHAQDAPLTDKERGQVLRVATAMALAGDSAGLARMKANYGRMMQDGAGANGFTVITQAIDPTQIATRDLAPTIAGLPTLESFMASYRERLQDGALSAIN